MRHILAIAALATAALPLVAAPAQAQAAQAAAYTTAETDIGTLIDNPATKAVLDKYLPGFTSNSQIEMARAMTLKQIQSYSSDTVTDEVLAKIDADLAKLPAKK